MRSNRPTAPPSGYIVQQSKDSLDKRPRGIRPGGLHDRLKHLDGRTVTIHTDGHSFQGVLVVLYYADSTNVCGFEIHDLGRVTLIPIGARIVALTAKFIDLERTDD